MSGTQFFYKRWEERVIKGEKVIVEFPESFNINNVLVSRWLEEEYCVWLDDGHEQATPVEIPAGTKVVNADKLKPVKSREWVLTQIILRGPDIARFRKASELIIEMDEKNDSYIKTSYPRIIPIPKEPMPQVEEKDEVLEGKVVNMDEGKEDSNKDMKEDIKEEKNVFAEVEDKEQ